MSGELRGDLLPRDALYFMLLQALECQRKLDMAKKALFHGKPSDYIEALLQQIGSQGPAYEPEDRDLIHGLLGIRTEADELLQLLKRVVQGGPLYRLDVIDELGDLIWYAQLTMNAIGTSFDEVMAFNRAKLTGCYPEGFNAEPDRRAS